ncbi:uncharacterized protein LOC143301228 [Babylonia areolata]|uniref:uncharacterized protein LOC143301228 n=1 Tax=Babylonia areolata TaxID=304850 RepID=UPI003FD211BB
MKLLITFALASLLLLKVAEGANVNYDVACDDSNTCSSAANMKCDGSSNKCVCTDATFGPKDDKTGCLLKGGETCDAGAKCLSNECVETKCTESGAGATAVSMMLMVVALVTSRFL